MKKQKKEKASEDTVRIVEKPSRKKKSKEKAVPTVEAQNSTPTLDELWKREQRIEKALTILAPKVDAIMKALKEGQERAEKQQALQQQSGPAGLPPVPKQGQKSNLPIPQELITKGIGILEKAFASPEPEGLGSIIEKKLITKAVDDIITTIDNDRAIGSAIRAHVKKHGLKGIIKFGETE